MLPGKGCEHKYLIAQYSCKWPTLGRPTGGHSFSRRTLPRNFVPILHHIFYSLISCPFQTQLSNRKPNVSSHINHIDIDHTQQTAHYTMSTEQSKEPTQCTRGCGFYGTGHMHFLLHTFLNNYIVNRLSTRNCACSAGLDHCSQIMHTEYGAVRRSPPLQPCGWCDQHTIVFSVSKKQKRSCSCSERTPDFTPHTPHVANKGKEPSASRAYLFGVGVCVRVCEKYALYITMPFGALPSPC